MNKRIYIKQWLKLKPYKKQTKTDSYYLRICNKVKQTITKNYKAVVPLKSYLIDKDIDVLSCFLTSYFEDLISDTNIWNTFIKLHKRLYNKQLPFFDLTEYYEEEINEQDVSFLIWYFLNTIQDKQYIEVTNNFIVEIAENVMTVFDEEWDYAPENEHLKTCYQINENIENFYHARDLIDTLLYKTYLFHTDCFIDLQMANYEITQAYEHDKHIDLLLYENRNLLLHKTFTRLLSLTGKEWVAELLGSKHALYDDFLNIATSGKSFFFYKGRDEDNQVFEHIASGKKFNVTNKSFQDTEFTKITDKIILMSIIRWKNEWWFSGAFAEQSYDEELVNRLRKSEKSRNEFKVLDGNEEKTNELLEKKLAVFKDCTNGSPIAFLSSENAAKFYAKYFESLSAINAISEEQKATIEQFLNSDSYKKEAEESKSQIVFFNPKKGVEVAFFTSSAFPMPENPYFKEEESEEDISNLLFNTHISPELANFCIDNCKDKLDFFQTGAGKKYLEDWDFLLRFWKVRGYHTES